MVGGSQKPENHQVSKTSVCRGEQTMVLKKGGRRRLTSVIVHGPPHMHAPTLTHEHGHRYRVLIARQKYESTYALFI